MSLMTWVQRGDPELQPGNTPPGALLPPLLSAESQLSGSKRKNRHFITYLQTYLVGMNGVKASPFVLKLGHDLIE